jgi:hypothetical protein
VQRGIGGRGMAVVMRLPVVRDASGLRVSTEVLR